MVKMKELRNLKDLCVQNIIEGITNDRNFGTLTLPRFMHSLFMTALREMCSPFLRFGREVNDEKFNKVLNGFPKYFAAIEALFEEARITELNLNGLLYIPKIDISLQALVSLDLSANMNARRNLAEVIGQATELRDLNLSGVFDLDHKVMKAVAERCGKLEKLSISWEYNGASPPNPIIVFIELKKAQAEVDATVLNYLKSVVVQRGETEFSTPSGSFYQTIKDYILLFPNLVEFQSRWSLRAVASICSDTFNQRVFKLSSWGTLKQLPWPENTPHTNLSTVFPDLIDICINDWDVSGSYLSRFEKMTRLTLATPLCNNTAVAALGVFLSTSHLGQNLTFLRIPSVAVSAAILFCPNLVHVVIHDMDQVYLTTDTTIKSHYDRVSVAGELPVLKRLQKVEVQGFDAHNNEFVLQAMETLLTRSPNLVTFRLKFCSWPVEVFIREEILATNGWKNLKKLSFEFSNVHPQIVVDILSDFSKLPALDWLYFVDGRTLGFEGFNELVWRDRINALRTGNLDFKLHANVDDFPDEFDEGF